MGFLPRATAAEGVEPVDLFVPEEAAAGGANRLGFSLEEAAAEGAVALCFFDDVPLGAVAIGRMCSASCRSNHEPNTLICGRDCPPRTFVTSARQPTAFAVVSCSRGANAAPITHTSAPSS